MASDDDDLDGDLRRADPDRWLSSRFVGDAALRADLVALYAFDVELAQVEQVTREPLAAEIRLTWWAEALDEILSGKPSRGHPILAALKTAVERRRLARPPLEAMVEARIQALDQPRFADPAGLERHIDATSGAVMALAVASLAGVDAMALRPAAQAWALAGMIRQRAAGGADRFPLGWDAGEAARRALAAARREAAGLPVAAFPAVAHLALAAPYLADRHPLGLEKRLRMTWAALSGRI